MQSLPKAKPVENTEPKPVSPRKTITRKETIKLVCYLIYFYPFNDYLLLELIIIRKLKKQKLRWRDVLLLARLLQAIIQKV
jgi:hypothetical protein